MQQNVYFFRTPRFNASLKCHHLIFVFRILQGYLIYTFDQRIGKSVLEIFGWLTRGVVLPVFPLRIYLLLGAYLTNLIEARMLKESVLKFVNVYGSRYLSRIICYIVESSQWVSTRRLFLLSSTTLETMAQSLHVEEVIVRWPYNVGF